ncbi:hypothetical protein [Agriterribacter sp.]|uniref:hypothetical protein n=1 Tax=Agriterribacter sp. TaxID=2821509 RepID=UPI002D0F449F|nr:hypothetical protein [Agriterribacter sp.]HRO44634.1 hypothetical protein [Agriterribacter sp.]HRQ16071.1 hypothetical protein [Agriterribacter sp.]
MNSYPAPGTALVLPVVKILAQFFSWLLHPLLVGLYMALYLIYFNPEYFMGVSTSGKTQTLFIYLINSVFFPLMAVLLCRGLGFVQSVYLKTQKERIILYAISMIFFFWTFYVFKNKPGIPVIMAQMSLGIFIAVIIDFVANIFFKISMHATGAGGLIGLFTVLLFTSPGLVNVPLAVAVFLAGLICTSRLIVSDHRTGDIVLGLMAGFASQWIAAWYFG